MLDLRHQKERILAQKAVQRVVTPFQSLSQNEIPLIQQRRTACLGWRHDFIALRLANNLNEKRVGGRGISDFFALIFFG